MRAFTAFDLAMGKFYHIVGSLVGISIAMFAVAISLDLFLRLFEVGNLPGMHEIIEYFLFGGVFLAAPWALRLGAHIRVDVLVTAMPPDAARIYERILDALGLIICLVLAWYGWKNMSQAFQFGSMQRNYFDVQEWWLLSVFVIGFVLLTIEFMSRFVRSGLPPEISGQSESGI